MRGPKTAPGKAVVSQWQRRGLAREGSSEETGPKQFGAPERETELRSRWREQGRTWSWLLELSTKSGSRQEAESSS